MTKKQSLLITLLAATMLSCTRESAPQKPNILLIFIDDMGWADLSCFGNTDAQTPNIDQLAAEGIAFEQFYVNSPIGSPPAKRRSFTAARPEELLRL